MVHLSFILSITTTSLLRLFAGKTEGAEHTGVGRHSSVHTRTCADDASTAITWAVPHNKKEQKQVSIKKISKRNLAYVGMVQYMNALADKVQKQDVLHTCTVICTP